MPVRIDVRYYMVDGSRWDDHKLSVLIGLSQRLWRREGSDIRFISNGITRLTAASATTMLANWPGATLDPLNSLGLAAFAAAYEQPGSVACICVDQIIDRSGRHTLGWAPPGRGLMAVARVLDMGRATIVHVHEQLHVLNQVHRSETLMDPVARDSFTSMRDDMWMPRSYDIPQDMLVAARTYALSSGLGREIL